MLADFFVENSHRLAGEPLGLGLAVLRGRIGAQRRKMRINVAAALAAHRGDYDRAAATHRKERPGVRNIRLASEEIDFHVRLFYAQIGQDRKCPARLQLVLDVDKRPRRTPVEHVDVAILALHPCVDFRVALPRGDRKQRQAVLRHRPRRHVPVPRMRHHYDDPLAFVHVALEFLLVSKPVDNILLHPRPVEHWSAHHLDARLEDIRKTRLGNCDELRMRLLREHRREPRHRALSLETENADHQIRQPPRNRHCNTIRYCIHQSAKRPESVILGIYRYGVLFAHEGRENFSIYDFSIFD